MADEEKKDEQKGLSFAEAVEAAVKDGKRITRWPDRKQVVRVNEDSSCTLELPYTPAEEDRLATDWTVI